MIASRNLPAEHPHGFGSALTAGLTTGMVPPPPDENTCPLASTTALSPLKRPTGKPFLAGMRVTVTSSPDLNEFLAQPFLVMSGGLLASTIQCLTSPLSSFSSNFSQQ